jgi:hypothetical protein
MTFNSFNALPKAKKIYAAVYSIPLEFRVIMALRHR